MRLGDLLALAWEALRAHRLRTRMTYAAITIGIGSVLVLTALGEGGRRWVIDRFATLGTNILVALPGRTETRGGVPMALMTTRDLTLEDADAVRRRMLGVERVVPITVGEATVTYERRGRASTIVGATSGFLEVRGIPVARGSNLPVLELDRGMDVCVIGRTIQRELFGEDSALGKRVRIGVYPFRVIGILAEQGVSMGVNLDEIVLLPVANALKMLNRKGLFRMIVQITPGADVELAKGRLRDVLMEQHDREEDFTILTPGAVAASLEGIIGTITAALAGIAAVSLAVAGIGVMNVMVVSVTERRAEIGLMKAVGASNGQVLSVFLAEAVVLSLIGGAFGIAGGEALTVLGRVLYPDVPFQVPFWALYLAVGITLSVGLVFGIAPAVRAARLEPLDALRKEV